MKKILMDGFNGILDTDQVAVQKMVKDRLTDGIKLWIDLEVNQ